MIFIEDFEMRLDAVDCDQLKDDDVDERLLLRMLILKIETFIKKSFLGIHKHPKVIHFQKICSS